MRFVSVLAAMGAVCLAGAAHGAVVQRNIDFVASNFISFDPPPYATVSGGFTLSFDPTMSVTDKSVDVVRSLSIPYTPSITFSYVASDQTLVIQSAGNGSVAPGFRLYLMNALVPSSPYALFSYRVAADPNRVYITETVNASNTAVPEPATWALLVIGFGAIGTAMRRNKTLTYA